MVCFVFLFFFTDLFFHKMWTNYALNWKINSFLLSQLTIIYFCSIVLINDACFIWKIIIKNKILYWSRGISSIIILGLRCHILIIVNKVERFMNFSNLIIDNFSKPIPSFIIKFTKMMYIITDELFLLLLRKGIKLLEICYNWRLCVHLQWKYNYIDIMSDK